MPEEDIIDVSRYLAGIKLKTKLSPVDETAPDFDASARLLESKRLMQIPLAEGDVGRGKKLYAEECASCHGKQGWGSHKKDVPMLAGQYTSYLVSGAVIVRIDGEQHATRKINKNVWASPS